MKKAISVADLRIEPGKKKHGTLKVSNALPDGTDVEISYSIYNGAHDGPQLYIQVAQHGVEIHAMEAIRTILSEIDLDKFRGALTYCLPNPIAFNERRTVMSYDEIPNGMNRVWPGRAEGSLTERMAYEVWRNLIKDRTDYLIDFHTGRRRAPVWVFYEAHGVSPGVPREVADKSERMAKVFGAELLYLETEPYGGGKTCRGAAVDNGIPGIVPEIGGESHFCSDQVAIAYRGLKNILIDLGMITGKIELPKTQIVLKWVIDRDRISAKAPKGGVFVPCVKIGANVNKGDSVGFIYSPRTFQEVAMVKSPQSGIVFSIVENPIVVAGQPLVTVPEVIEEITN